MKNSIAAFLAFAFSLSSFAAVTLGIEDGTYHGSGTLHSESAGLVKLVADRTFRAGVLHSKTRAQILGVTVLTAIANLKIEGADEHFVFTDLDHGGARAGTARCTAGRCAVNLTLLEGDLVLHETWVPGGDGFQVLNGRLTYKGRPSTYSANFNRR